MQFFISIYAYLMPCLDKFLIFHQLIYFDLEIEKRCVRHLLKGQKMNFFKMFVLVNTWSTYMCWITHDTAV